MVMLGWFAPDPTPVLEGPHVVLRGPRPRDYEAWRALRRASRDFLKPFEPRWTEADLNRQAFAARLWRGRQEARRGTDYSVGLGFYAFLRFHVDTTKYRRWGADPNVASCPPIVRPADVASVGQPVQTPIVSVAPSAIAPVAGVAPVDAGPKVVFAPPSSPSPATDTQPQ